MTEKLLYYFECYLHQDWNEECGSTNIRDTWKFFFDNECDGDGNMEVHLGNRLIKDIDMALEMSDYDLGNLVNKANYCFDSLKDARTWLSEFKSWITIRIK